MKRIALLLVCVIAAFTAPANARVHVSFDFFFDSLSPYGEWVTAGDYGPVWHPAGVDGDWTPYSDGYWSYTDAGWTWVSYEDWGGITYHYGRWVRLSDYGWCWVPDYEWGPAWVSWRRSDDYVGWAPLPPEARWNRGTGFSTWVDTEFDIGPAWFRFCRVRDFGAPFIRPVLLPWERNYAIIHQTFNITNISYRADRGCAFNQGPDFAWIAPLTARPLPALKLVRHTSDIFVPGSRGNVLINAPRGNTLVVAAPPVLPGVPLAPRANLPVARAFPAPRIDRGWAAPPGGVSLDPIRAAFKQQTSGATPKSAPARPFQPGLVSVVPKKADLKAKALPPPPLAGLPLTPPQPGAVVRPQPAVPGVPAMGRTIPQGVAAQPQLPPAKAANPALPPPQTVPGVTTPSFAAPKPGKSDVLSGLREKMRGGKSPAPVPSAPAIPAPVTVTPSAPPVQAPTNRMKPPGIEKTQRQGGSRFTMPQVLPPSGIPTPVAPRIAPAPKPESKRFSLPPVAQPPPSADAFRQQLNAQRQQQAAAAAAAAARQRPVMPAPPVPAPQIPSNPSPRQFGLPAPGIPAPGTAIPGAPGRKFGRPDGR